MKFIHAGDFHLGMEPDKDKPYGEERREELWEGFFRLIDICQEEKPDLLLIAGDLFHRQPLVRDLQQVNYGFANLPATQVVMIAGNHDYLTPRSNYRNFKWAENVHLFLDDKWDRIYLPSCHTYLYGFSYHQRKAPGMRLSDIRPGQEEGYHILLAHGGEEGRLPIRSDWLAMMKFDYAAFGHIHKQQWLRKNAAFCGSFEPLDINETGAHGYILGELSEEERSFRFIPAAKREYRQVRVEVIPGMTDWEVRHRIQEEIEAGGREHMYRFLLTGLRDRHVIFPVEEMQKLGRINQIIDETVPDYDFEGLERENKNNVIGMYIEAVRKSGAPDEICDRALFLGMEVLTGTE
ncbi:DNA repair exonuclease [Anaerolentibacter hominis]|uniref:metallophosphoesterase family protein n=1 Tax=Anaerolentibacter hominis TaxID=3079009 RepID=UPI0031B890A2